MLCIMYLHELLEKDQMVYTSRVLISSSWDCTVIFVSSKSDWNNKTLHGIKYSKWNTNRVG